jgi:UDP-N-acetylglucosamine diphosphorylase/glucosamine-1-phosphate N-acetyltransferase
MIIQLNDNNLHKRFAPLSLTRPIGNLRVGILTNNERWELFLPEAQICYNTEDYLQGKFPKATGACIEVNAQLIPNEEIVASVISLEMNEALYFNGIWIASKGTGNNKVNYSGESPIILEQRWHLYQKNAEILKHDFNLLTQGRTSQPLNDSNMLIGDESQVFLEEGAVVNASILNTTSGPIYIGKEAEIMEGSIVRGGLAMCEHSALKLGTKVYGAVTLGPHCKVGGEVNNVVFQAFSNKGHDGFLGNALVGEWCNLGADTNTSNLKNNYGNVSTYSYETKQEEKTDIQFMGVCMGDHSKCGINTMFNTATVVGVSSNIYGAGFPDKYCASFQWGGPEGMVPFRFDKAIEYANNMMIRRGLQLTEEEIQILKYILESNL